MDIKVGNKYLEYSTDWHHEIIQILNNSYILNSYLNRELTLHHIEFSKDLVDNGIKCGDLIRVEVFPWESNIPKPKLECNCSGYDLLHYGHKCCRI